MQKPYLLLGEIVRPQGIRGEVKVRHATDDPRRFETLETVYRKQGEEYLPVKVLLASVRKDDVFLLLEGVGDRNAAEALRGTELYVDRAHARELNEGEVFIADLLGAPVEDSTGRKLGTVKDVYPAGGADVMVVSTAKGELSLPMLARVLLTLSAERVVLDADVLGEVALYEDSDTDDLPGNV